MLYTAIVEIGNDETAWGVKVPDIKGCYSAGDTLEEALANAREAIEGHLEILAEDGEPIPEAQPSKAHLEGVDFDTHLVAVVDVDITPFLGKAEKINVTLPKLLIKQIDSAVEERKGDFKNRSFFLQNAALEKLRSIRAS